MPRTEFVNLQGKVKWCRPTVPDPWGNYKTSFYPDEKSLNKIRDLQAEGLKNVLKKDDDGYYTTFRRPQSKTIRGKVVGFTPVEVTDGTQKLPDGSHPPLRDVLIGNMSDVTLTLEVYTHGVPGTDKKAKAARWLAVRVDNLVPYEGRKDLTYEEDRATAPSATVPQPTW